jgi:hypothetical protein
MGRNFRPVLVLLVVLVLLLLLRKGGDLVVTRPDVDVNLQPIPNTVFPTVLIPRRLGMKETTDAMCDCDGPPVDPGVNIYLPVVEAQPTIAAVYQFFPRSYEGERMRGTSGV